MCLIITQHLLQCCPIAKNTSWIAGSLAATAKSMASLYHPPITRAVHAGRTASPLIHPRSAASTPRQSYDTIDENFKAARSFSDSTDRTVGPTEFSVCNHITDGYKNVRYIHVSGHAEPKGPRKPMQQLRMIAGWFASNSWLQPVGANKLQRTQQ